MSNSDKIIKGLLLDDTANVIAISGRNIVEFARKAHGLSHVCTAALGRLLMETAMLSCGLKNATDNITIVIDGNGYAGKFVAVGKEGGKVKGYVDCPTVELPLKANGKLDVAGVVGTQGELRVIRDLSLKEPYVGRCPITDGEIANDFANYFVMSEQQPSLVYLGVRVNPENGAVRSAAGIMIQPLPFCPDESISKIEAIAGDVSDIAKRIDEGYTLDDVLNDIFSDMNYRVTEVIEPAFKCDCCMEKLEAALVSLGREELGNMIENDHGAELVCSFCNKKYYFNEQELRALLEYAVSKEE